MIACRLLFIGLAVTICVVSVGCHSTSEESNSLVNDSAPAKTSTGELRSDAFYIKRARVAAEQKFPYLPELPIHDQPDQHEFSVCGFYGFTKGYSEPAVTNAPQSVSVLWSNRTPHSKDRLNPIRCDAVVVTMNIDGTVIECEHTTTYGDISYTPGALESIINTSTENG